MKNRAKFIKTILLLDELNNHRTILFLGSSISNYRKLTTEFLRQLKQNILSLYLLKGFINENAHYLKDNNQFNTFKKSINKELEFVNHIRNKISGHYDDTLMLKAAQWEPLIFFSENKSDDFKLLLSYISIFESSINSFVLENGNHKLYNSEIDLTIPESRKLFFDTIYKLNDTGIIILTIIKDTLEADNIFYSKENFYEESTIAGYTNFNLKDKTPFDKDKILNDNKTSLDDEIKDIDFSDIDSIFELRLKLVKIIGEIILEKIKKKNKSS